MDDPIEQQEEKRSESAAKRLARARSSKTAAIVLLVTVLFGVIAFVLIESTKTAAISTVLIFLAALTVRLLERE